MTKKLIYIPKKGRLWYNPKSFDYSSHYSKNQTQSLLLHHHCNLSLFHHFMAFLVAEPLKSFWNENRNSSSTDTPPSKSNSSSNYFWGDRNSTTTPLSSSSPCFCFSTATVPGGRGLGSTTTAIQPSSPCSATTTISGGCCVSSSTTAIQPFSNYSWDNRNSTATPISLSFPCQWCRFYHHHHCNPTLLSMFIFCHYHHFRRLLCQFLHHHCNLSLFSLYLRCRHHRSHHICNVWHPWRWQLLSALEGFLAYR